MRSEDTGLWGKLRTEAANHLRGIPDIDEQADRESLRAAHKGILEAWRLCESLIDAADKNDVKRFVAIFDGFKEINAAVQPLAECTLGAFAAVAATAGRDRPTAGGLAYASYHHFLWAEAVAFHYLTAMATMQEIKVLEDDDEVISTSTKEIKDNWRRLVTAVRTGYRIEAPQAEVYCLDELRDALALCEGDAGAERPIGPPRYCPPPCNDCGGKQTVVKTRKTLRDLKCTACGETSSVVRQDS